MKLTLLHRPMRRPRFVTALLALLGLFTLGASVPSTSARAEIGSGPKPTVVLVRPFRQPGGALGNDAYIDPALFHDVFVGDVPASTAAEMAASQRPLTLAAGTELTQAVAWRSIPSWYMVAGLDHTIPPDV